MGNKPIVRRIQKRLLNFKKISARPVQLRGNIGQGVSERRQIHRQVPKNMIFFMILNNRKCKILLDNLKKPLKRLILCLTYFRFI